MKRNTRAEARRLFPFWGRTMQAKWVLARLRTRSGTWRFPIGVKAPASTNTHDFIRVLPPDTALIIKEDARDRLRKGLRFVKGLK